MKIFSKTVLASTIFVLFGSGCNSPPTVAMPNGSNRVEINSSVVAHDYEVRVSQEAADRNYRTEMLAKVESMNTQIKGLLGYILKMENEKKMMEAQGASPVSTQPIKATPNATKIYIKAEVLAPQKKSSTNEDGSPFLIEEKVLASKNPSGQIEVLPGSVVFRVTHDYAKTEFKPSDAMKDKILSASRTGNSIEVKGRTDAFHTNDGDRKIAIERANNARRFLVENGIENKKIQTTFLSARDYIADNTTAEGRALNRRVEIKVNGFDGTAYKNSEMKTIASN